MMDYYGSITMDSDTIRKQMYTQFSEYSEEYIDAKMSRLETLDKSYSVAGWNVFFRKIQVDLIQSEIQKDTEVAKQRLTLAKISESEKGNEIPMDVILEVSKCFSETEIEHWKRRLQTVRKTTGQTSKE